MTPDGSIYITDAMNFRVQRFGPDGLVRSLFGQAGDGTGDFAKPKGVAVDSAGTIYVVDALHNSAPVAPLWNRALSGATYTPYTSSTLDAAVDQPTGSSKLCLSCHDGTIALGAVISRAQAIEMAGGVTVMPAGPALLGTDLGDDHPISFVYDGALSAQDAQLRHPGTLTDAVKLDRTGQLQCRSCHDPHDNRYGRSWCRRTPAPRFVWNAIR